jgi:predicted MFS family arabinose efflux permease
LFAAYLIIQFAAPRLIAEGYHLNTTQIGLVFLPTGAMGASLSNLAGRLAGRVPPVWIIMACAASSTLGLLLTAAAGRAAVPLVIAVGLTVSAFSAGQVVLMGIVPSLADPAHRGVASGVFQLVFLTGGSLGSAIIGGLSGVLPLRVAVALLAAIPLAGILCATGIDSGKNVGDSADNAIT